MGTFTYARGQRRGVGAICLLIAGVTMGYGIKTARAVTFDPTNPNNGGINSGGLPVLSNQNPGGQFAITHSNTQETTNIDTPSTVTLNHFQVTVEGVLDGSQNVFDQTFTAPFNDAAVQNAVGKADAALVGAGATSFTGPVLTSNATVLENSETAFTQTGSSSSSSTSEADTFGPATLFNVVGGRSILFFQPVFTVLTGQLVANINTDTITTIERNAVTTDTNLTTQTYVISGTSAGSGPAVPEPMSLTLIPVAVMGLAVRKWRRR